MPHVSAESATETYSESGLYITNSRRHTILQEEINPSKIFQPTSSASTLTKPPPQKKHISFTLISMVVQVIEVRELLRFFRPKKNYSGSLPPPQGHTAPGAVSGRRGLKGRLKVVWKRSGEELHRDIYIYIYTVVSKNRGTVPPKRMDL